MFSKEYPVHKPMNGKGREKTYRQSDRFIVPTKPRKRGRGKEAAETP
jgi:hypothetical protein